jgi:hypothetical protein
VLRGSGVWKLGSLEAWKLGVWVPGRSSASNFAVVVTRARVSQDKPVVEAKPRSGQYSLAVTWSGEWGVGSGGHVYNKP